MLNQHFQNLKWLCLKPDSDSMFSEFTRPQINLKGSKKDAPERFIHFLHCL
jgi:hypothetical protein